MRALFIASYFPRPNNTLMGTWALGQAQALLRQGVEVRVLSPVPAVPRLVGRVKGGSSWECPPSHTWGDLDVLYPRWPYYPVGPLRGWIDHNPARALRFAFPRIRAVIERVVQQFRPDVIHAHHAQVGGYLARRIFDKWGIPYIVTDHSLEEIASCQGNPGRQRHFERVLQRAGSWVAPSSRLEREMNSVFPGVSTQVVHNGTDPIPGELMQTVRPDGLRGKKVVFCASFFYRIKNVPLLVGAFATAARAYPDAVLRIAGDGDDAPAVFQAIRESGCPERIELLGRLPHRQVLQELVWCDVFASVGVSETFATVFLEAAAAGRPAIYASDGGITDVLEDRVHGLAVPPNNADATAKALSELLGDEELRARMAKSASGLFESALTWDRNAIAMKAVLAAARGTGDE